MTQLKTLLIRSVAIAAAVLVVFASTSNAQVVRQTQLYIDDNTGVFAILKALTGGGTFNFPGVGGTNTVITTGNLSSITGLGTINSGTWKGDAIGLEYGGTGGDNTSIANHLFFAGPISGGPGNAGFRAIDATDLPIATTSALGAVEPDGTSITITAGGVISTVGAPPTGTAGGDLTGSSYPNPTISAIDGTTLTITSLTAKDVLYYNGSAWVNQQLASSDLSDVGSLATTTDVSNAITTAEGYTDNAVGNAITLTEGYTDNAVGNAITLTEGYTDNAVGNAITLTEGYTDNAVGNAITLTEGYTDNAVSNAVTLTEGYTDNAVSNAVTLTEGYTDNAVSNAVTLTEGYTDNAVSNAITTAEGFATTAANNAQANAEAASVLLAPTAAQTITPATDFVPLTIEDASGGTKDMLDIEDGSGNSVASFSPGLNGLTLGNPTAGVKQGILRLYNASGTYYTIAPTGTVVEVNTDFQADGSIQAGNGSTAGSLLITDGSGHSATLNDPAATNSPVFNLPAESGAGPYTLATTGDITGNFVQITPGATQTITPSLTGVVPLTIQGLDGAANLQDWNNSSSTTVASIDASGDASFVGLSSTGAANVATGATQLNTFGNGSDDSNVFGGGGATSVGTRNNFGDGAIKDYFGNDAATNWFGRDDTSTSMTNNFGLASHSGYTLTNLIGVSTQGGAGVNTQIGNGGADVAVSIDSRYWAVNSSGAITTGMGTQAGALKIGDGSSNTATLNDPDATNDPTFNLPAESGAGPYTLATTDDILSPGNFIQNNTGPAQTTASFDIDGSGTFGGNINLPATTSATVGVITMNGSPWMYGYPSTQSNQFMGLGSGNFTMTTASNDVAVGPNVLQDLTTGSQNTGIGAYALVAPTTGGNNTGVGYNAMNKVVDGSDNTGVGNLSGNAIVDGSQNTFLGSSADAAGDVSNATAIGYGANVAASNTIQLGNTSVTLVNTSGAMNLGSPAATTAGTLSLNTSKSGATFGGTLELDPAGAFTTQQQTYKLPDASGTIALTSDIPTLGSYIDNQSGQQTSANFNIDGNGTLGGTLTNAGDATLGTGATATANSFGTSGNAAAVANTIGSTFTGSTTTINGETELSNTTATGGGEVRTDYTVADATSVASTRATGNYTEAISNSGGLSYPTATGILADAEWTGGLNTTDQIVGLQGETHPGSGITALGVVGEADQTNPTDNTGVLGFAVNGGNANVGVAGTANATEAQIVTYQGTLPAGFGAGVLGYNQASTAGQYSGYFYGLNNAAGSSTVRIQSDPGNAMTPGIDEFALSNWISGTDGAAASASPTTIRGQYNNAQSSGNNVRTEGGLFEAATNGVGLGAISDNPQSTGIVGLADYDNGSDAPTTDFLVGVRGATYTPTNKTNGLNVVGENFGGSYYRSVGGYFYPSNGTDANLGVVAQIGGSDQGAWQDAAFTGINAAVVGINYNTPTATNLAGYFGGNVVATGNITSGNATTAGALVITDGATYNYTLEATTGGLFSPTFLLPVETSVNDPYTLATTADIAAITGNFVALAPSATQTITPAVTDVVPLTIQGFDASVDLQDWNNSSSLTVASIDASGNATFVGLTSSGNSTIATGASTVNSFGSGASAHNYIGNGGSEIDSIGNGGSARNYIGRGGSDVNHIGGGGSDSTIIGANITSFTNIYGEVGINDSASSSSGVNIANNGGTGSVAIGNTTGGVSITGTNWSVDDATGRMSITAVSGNALSVYNSTATDNDLYGNNWSVTEAGDATFTNGISVGTGAAANVPNTIQFKNGDQGTLNTADLNAVGAQTWTLPPASGTIALQGHTDAATMDATNAPDFSAATTSLLVSTYTSGGAVAMTIPAPVNGSTLTILWDKGDSTLTITPASGTILKGSSFVTPLNTQGATLVAYGTNWYVVGIY